MSICYKKETAQMILFAEEQYKLRTNSYQMNMVVFSLENDAILIDIIGAAGGSGMLNISLWSESGFTKNMTKYIEKYCAAKGIEMQQL